jgi:organic hydroperoxide reductase OsmC/OhrA
MAEHKATIRWHNEGADFRSGRFFREHTWSFDGGLTVPASSSPSNVRAPYSNPANVDPEEAFVAAIASCHMLWFLHLAQRAGYDVISYDDDAVGVMTKNERQVSWISSVVLTPRIVYGDNPPSAAEIARLHEEAHHECFIANSVKTEITVKPL